MFKKELQEVPKKPGCYQMYNSDGIIIYVGKAKILQNRLRSYFTGRVTGKTKKMVSEVDHFEYIVTDTETEAFVLELNLIKKHDPKYNILLRDDKSYPYIELTNEKVPTLKVVRSINRKKNQKNLYGPYPNVTAARGTVNLLNRIYPLKKCRTYPKKTCLYYHIGQCLGYCVYDIDKDKIESMKSEIIKFLNGDDSIVREKLEREMEEESKQMHYEKALEIKQLLDYIKVTLTHQKVELKDNVNRDIFGYYVDKGYISIQVFFIRNSKIIERHSKIFHLIENDDEELTRYIANFYNKDILKPYNKLAMGGGNNESSLLLFLLKVQKI